VVGDGLDSGNLASAKPAGDFRGLLTYVLLAKIAITLNTHSRGSLAQSQTRADFPDVKVPQLVGGGKL